MKAINVEQKDSVTKLQKAIKSSRDAGQKTRLRAIIKLKQGETRTTLSKEFVVNRSTISYWIEQYNAGGISALVFNKGGRPKGSPKWNTDIFTELSREIDKGGYWSIPRMQAWIQKKYKKDIPEQTIWYRMDKQGYSYKGARPHPCQGDKEKQDMFKKGASLRSWSKE